MPNSTQDDDRAGRAALLLVESLIHSLISSSVLTVAEAVEIVETAAEVDQDAAQLMDGPAAPISLLTMIADSLRIDLRVRP